MLYRRAAACVCLLTLSFIQALSANIDSTWDIAYRALCDPETASKSEPLRAFLTSGENTQILSRPWKPFPDPSSQEKSKFESKTAPISVAPSPNAPYNLDEIKEDSLWLSKEAQISEYAALQLVAQEWQSRPVIQLLSGLTEEEALSVQDAAGITNMGASTFAPIRYTRPAAAAHHRHLLLNVRLYPSHQSAPHLVGSRASVAKSDYLWKQLPLQKRCVDRRARSDRYYSSEWRIWRQCRRESA
jgi:hypothetical protein